MGKTAGPKKDMVNQQGMEKYQVRPVTAPYSTAEERTDESMSHRFDYEMTAGVSMSRHGKGLARAMRTGERNPLLTAFMS